MGYLKLQASPKKTSSPKKLPKSSSIFYNNELLVRGCAVLKTKGVLNDYLETRVELNKTFFSGKPLVF